MQSLCIKADPSMLCSPATPKIGKRLPAKARGRRQQDRLASPAELPAATSLRGASINTGRSTGAWAADRLGATAPRRDVTLASMLEHLDVVGQPEFGQVVT